MFHFRVIEAMFTEVDTHIDDGKLISEFKMSALPSLYGQFVQLIKYLVIFCAFESAVSFSSAWLSKSYLVI